MELKTPKHCSCGNTYFDGCGNGWEIYIGEEVEFVNFCPNEEGRRKTFGNEDECNQ